jgi:hypothetical protein
MAPMSMPLVKQATKSSTFFPAKGRRHVIAVSPCCVLSMVVIGKWFEFGISPDFVPGFNAVLHRMIFRPDALWTLCQHSGRRRGPHGFGEVGAKGFGTGNRIWFGSWMRELEFGTERGIEGGIEGGIGHGSHAEIGCKAEDFVPGWEWR